MTTLRRLGPGCKAPVSGQYEVLDESGRLVDREVTVVRGEPLPPLSGKGWSYRLADATTHKKRRR